jgi:hypothetical protein
VWEWSTRVLGLDKTAGVGENAAAAGVSA